MARVPVNDEILRKAREMDGRVYCLDRGKLRQIISGKIKNIDVEWWRRRNGVSRWQLERQVKEKAERTIRKVKAMTDPALNPNAHQRRVAEEMLAKLQAKLQAEIDAIRPPSAPGLEEYDRLYPPHQPAPAPTKPKPVNTKMYDGLFQDFAQRVTDAMRSDPDLRAVPKAAPVNTSEPEPAADPVNTKPEPEPEPEPVNTKPRSDRHRDRHSPGYMREYMRRRRAARKPSS
jgi:hypothetical protein